MARLFFGMASFFLTVRSKVLAYSPHAGEILELRQISDRPMSCNLWGGLYEVMMKIIGIFNPFDLRELLLQLPHKPSGSCV